MYASVVLMHTAGGGQSNPGRPRKLLEERLEKLKIEKGLNKSMPVQSEKQSPSAVPELEGHPKMRVLKRNVPNNNEEVPITNGVTTPMSPMSSSNGVIDLTQEESMRTQYVPPEPRISVLSRPKKKTPAEELAASKSSKQKNQPAKTLEQREQEYAEARRRIFGGDTLET